MSFLDVIHSLAGSDVCLLVSYKAVLHYYSWLVQNELDRMQLPETVRWRIQSAMPILFPSVRWSISCQPPSVAPAALSSLLPSNPISVLHSSNGSNQTQRTPVSLLRTATSVSGKAKHVSSQQENDLEVDPWILLEDGAGSSQSSSNSTLVGGSDNANLKASNWLKGTVRVRRTDLTYIGAVDDDSWFELHNPFWIGGAKPRQVFH